MKSAKLFENVGAPEPPESLRERTLGRARRSFQSEPSISWVIRLSESHAAGVAWSAAVAASLLILILWNPAMPGMRPSGGTETISAGNPLELDGLPMRPSGVSAHLRSKELSRILKGGDL